MSTDRDTPSAVSRFVSNTDRDIFAVVNLPEEVIAVLFAYFSRSKFSLRENLERLLRDEDLGIGGGGESLRLALASDRARKFHEKWVVGYGHGSVAEHAVLHLAVEKCSIVAAKALERHRLLSATEKSTRYVLADQSGLVRDVGFVASSRSQAVYERGAYALLDAYAELVTDLRGQFAELHPEQDAMVRDARCFDLLRGLLPAGFGTNVGITVNARSLIHVIRTLAESELPEAHHMAEGLQREAITVVPTLLRHLEPSRHRMGASERVGAVLRAMAHDAGALLDEPEPWFPGEEQSRGHEVELLRHEGASPLDLATSILQEVGDVASMRPGGRRAMTESRALEVIEAYLSDRGEWDAVCRAMEHATFRFEIACDYGAWRDLQRHRMNSSTTPWLTAREGYACPEGLAQFGLEGRFRKAVEAAALPYFDLSEEHGRGLSQYVVPLAYRVRWVTKINLREVFQTIELRSSSAGHPSYRAVVIDMADAVLRVCPWLRPHLRVDRNGYVWAREPKAKREVSA